MLGVLELSYIARGSKNKLVMKFVSKVNSIDGEDQSPPNLKKHKIILRDGEMIPEVKI